MPVKKRSIFSRIALVCIASMAMLSSLWVARSVFFTLPVSTDEGSYAFQAYAFRDGVLARPYPPMGSLLRRPHDMLIMDRDIGWLSRYPPGHALWLLPGAWLNQLHLMVMVAAGVSVLMLGLACSLVGAPPLLLSMLLLLSPFFLIMFGTLFSHTSGFLAVCFLLWGYIRMRQTGASTYGAIAGMAWALLFLNRTFTAVLLAIPFALDTLWILARQRDRSEFRLAVIFGGTAVLGPIFYLAYNGLVTGSAGTPTYLVYDATQTLGFGMRHLNGLPVKHTFLRGLAHSWENILALDHWLFGVRLALPAALALGVLGWSRRWSWILLGGPICLIAGYIFFWFPGPRHIGPAYYFEALPFLFLWMGTGLHRIDAGLRHFRRTRYVLGALACLTLLVPSVRFVQARKAYFNHVLASQQLLSQTLQKAPPQSIIFLRNIQYPPFGKLTINERGTASDPLVLQAPEQVFFADVLKEYPGRSAFLVEGGREHELQRIASVPSQRIVARRAFTMARHVGRNQVIDGHEWRVASGDGDGSGYLAFGFRRMIPPGQYLLHFDFGEVTTPRASGSYIDVAADYGRTIIGRKELSPMAAGGRLTIPVTVPGNDFIRAEPRVFYGGDGVVAVQQILFERLPTGAQARTRLKGKTNVAAINVAMRGEGNPHRERSGHTSGGL